MKKCWIIIWIANYMPKCISHLRLGLGPLMRRAKYCSVKGVSCLFFGVFSTLNLWWCPMWWQKHRETYTRTKSPSYIEETLEIWERGGWVVVAKECSLTLKFNFESILVLLQVIYNLIFYLEFYKIHCYASWCFTNLALIIKSHPELATG